jgi:hypothetical protein
MPRPFVQFAVVVFGLSNITFDLIQFFGFKDCRIVGKKHG